MGCVSWRSDGLPAPWLCCPCHPPLPPLCSNPTSCALKTQITAQKQGDGEEGGCVAHRESRRAVATWDLKHASCRGPPPQSADAHSTAAKGFTKGGKKTVAVKNYLPKVQAPVINDFSKICMPVLSGVPTLSLQWICSKASHHEQHLNPNSVSHCPSSRGMDRMHAELETCVLKCPFMLFWFMASPPDSQQMDKITIESIDGSYGQLMVGTKVGRQDDNSLEILHQASIANTSR